MPIVPDTKDWTWVLERACPQCGFDPAGVEFRDLPSLIRRNAAAWPAVLRREGARDRPDDETWSALEYGAHVRDVYRIFVVRLGRLRTEDDPAFESWDQDRTAIEDDYAGQDPHRVGQEIVEAAEVAATAFADARDDELERTGRRSDGAVFSVRTLGLYFLHDPVHHLWDVRG